MGAWDSGLFDNDTAADWCDDLDDATPRSSCDRAIDGGDAAVAA